VLPRIEIENHRKKRRQASRQDREFLLSLSLMENVEKRFEQQSTSIRTPSDASVQRCGLRHTAYLNATSARLSSASAGVCAIITCAT
jgi:hypothetical protein